MISNPLEFTSSMMVLSESKITWKKGHWVCQWGIILINLTQVGRAAHCGCHHFLSMISPLYKVEKASRAQTRITHSPYSWPWMWLQIAVAVIEWWTITRTCELKWALSPEDIFVGVFYHSDRKESKTSSVKSDKKKKKAFVCEVHNNLDNGHLNTV